MFMKLEIVDQHLLFKSLYIHFLNRMNLLDYEAIIIDSKQDLFRIDKNLISQIHRVNTKKVFPLQNYYLNHSMKILNSMKDSLFG